MTLQAKQQRHERDLYELKIKAERESLEAQLQLEENRQRMAMVQLHKHMLTIMVNQILTAPKNTHFTRYIHGFEFKGMSAVMSLCMMVVYGFIQAHIELQESFAVRKKESLEGLQDATTKMMSQQAEAAQYTADAARHIKEVSNYCLPLCLENRPCIHCMKN